MTETCVNGVEVKTMDLGFVFQLIQFVKAHPEIVAVAKEIFGLVQQLTAPTSVACEPKECCDEKGDCHNG